MPFGVGFKPEASFAERRLFADAGNDVLQLATLAIVIEHVVRRDDRRAASFANLGQRCDAQRGVVVFNLLDQPPRAYNKFIPYYHHPSIRYVVGLSIGPDGRIKLTAGYNPWLPRGEREHDISVLCERIGGGGHPYVGGASFARDAEHEALAAQRWIAGVLRGAAAS